MWPARLELIGEGDQAVLIDGAHNPAAARVLASYILEVFARPLPIVIGAMRDKNIAEMVQALAPCASAFICTSPDSPRAAPPADIAALVAAHAPQVPAMRRHNRSRPSRSRARSDRPSSSQARCIWPAKSAQN